MHYTDESELSFYGKFRTYKIEKGDTLQNVAQKLGVEARELRRYHNAYCLISDLIEDDFKRYSKFLILAPEKKALEINDTIDKKLRQVSLGKNNKLPFLPKRISKDYSVQYTFESGGKIDKIEKAVRIKWIAFDVNKYHLFEINRSSNIYINDKLPDSMINELAFKTVEVLYPLKIIVDEFGKWIDIYNYIEIQRRWKKTKSEILDYYEGEVVKAYIKHTERVLENSERLLESLRSNYFLNIFFNGIHVEYTADYEFQNNLLFPLEKEIESVFHVQHKMVPNLDERGFIKIEQKGHYVDSGYGFLYGYTPSKVNYNAAYFLNSDAYTVEQINFEFNFESDKSIKTAIVIKLLES